MRVGSRAIGCGKCAHDYSRDGFTGGTCGGGQCNFHGSELIQTLSLCMVYFTSESWLDSGPPNTLWLDHVSAKICIPCMEHQLVRLRTVICPTRRPIGRARFVILLCCRCRLCQVASAGSAAYPTACVHTLLSITRNTANTCKIMQAQSHKSTSYHTDLHD